MGLWNRRPSLRPDFVVKSAGRPVLQRWHVLPRNRLFNIYLHRFVGSDDHRALHDHPWWNASVLLWGSYVEHTPDGRSTMRSAPCIVVRQATHAHRIALPYALILEDGHWIPRPVPAWTLFITGPKSREWGFLCPRGWRPWQEFVHPTDRGAVGPGCD